MAASSNAVLTSAILNLCIALIGLFVFSFLRTWRKCSLFFNCKANNLNLPVRPEQPKSGLLAWIPATWNYSEADLIRESGLDTAIYLRLLRFGLEIFFWISLCVLAVILPVNVTGGQVETDLANKPDSPVSDFDKLSLSNVPAESYRMWAHVIMVYIVSGIVLQRLWRFSCDSVLLRIMFLGNSPPAGPTHTVLVRDIPAVMDVTAKAAKERALEGKALKKTETARRKQEKKDQAKFGPSKDGQTSIQSVNSISSGNSVAPKGGRAEIESAPTKDSGAPSSIEAVVLDMEPGEAASVRQRKTFNYDLSSTSLDPRVMAMKELDKGVDPLDLVKAEFDFVYPPGSVTACNMVHDIGELLDPVDEYNKRTQQLQDYLDGYHDRIAKGEPLVAPNVLLIMPDAWCKEKYGGGIIKSVPAMEFWLTRLPELEKRILEGQVNARKLVWPSAFVTFGSRVLQSVSATGLHHHDETAWTVRGAPGPTELLWCNLGMTSAQRTVASSVVWVLFGLMCLFFTIPIAAIQGLIDVNKFASFSPGLASFLNNVVISKLIQAIVPGLVLKIFLAFLPAILAFMVKKSGAVAQSEVDFGVVSRFMIFQVIVVFFGTIIAGSFFSQASKLISNPTSIISVLGTAIPQTSTFFITFLWVQLGTKAIGACRLVGVILYWLFTYLAGSPRAAARVWQEQMTTYGTAVTDHTMAILLGLAFCCINPIIAPTVFCYFVVVTLVEGYNAIYVYRKTYESGGQMWCKVLNQVMTGLYIFQLCMIGLISLKKFPYSVVIIPVLLPTLIFHFTCHQLFARPWTIMSLHDAAELDKNDKVETLEEQHDPALEYTADVFKVHRGDLDTLLAEAKIAGAVVAEDVARRAAEAEAAKGRKSKAKAEVKDAEQGFAKGDAEIQAAGSSFHSVRDASTAGSFHTAAGGSIASQSYPVAGDK